MKELAYLDHNVVDFLYKNPNSSLEDWLKRDFQVFFSEENLAEIQRCGEKANDYAMALERLNPMYLNMKRDKSSRAKDEATLKAYPVSGLLRTRKKTVPRLDELKASFSQPLLKSLGGLKGKNYDKIHEEQMNLYRQSGRVLGESIKQAKRRIEEYEKKLIRRKKQTDKTLQAFGEYDGVNTIRNTVGVTPRELNNIKPPNVILKIWEKVKSSDHIKKSNSSLENFFGIDKKSVNIKGNYPIHLKMSIMYMMLNAIGYKQDNEILDEKRFLASVSDATHVGNAAFGSVFFTMDKNLCEKAVAVYEYFKIGPRIVHFKKR